eukprot:scaffold54241_cov63-Phaeocystis_antarctica.AAC.5
MHFTVRSDVEARRVSVIVVDDGVHALVIRRDGAQVGRRQPAEGGALEPAALDEQLVEHLVVGRLLVGLVCHRLGPRDEQLLGLEGLVEEGNPAARVGRVPVGDVGLVAPVVEEGDVAVAVGPAARHEELRELVQLEVNVHEDHGQLSGLELGEDEGGLQGDGPEAEGLRSLRRVRSEGVGRERRRLAAHAHALARVDQAARLGFVLGRVHRDADKLVELALAEGAHQHGAARSLAREGQLARHVLVLVVGDAVSVGEGRRERPRAPERVVGRVLQEHRVDARVRARVVLEKVEGRALGRVHALVRLLRGAVQVALAPAGPPKAVGQAHSGRRIQLDTVDQVVRLLRHLAGQDEEGLVLDGGGRVVLRLVADALVGVAVAMGHVANLGAKLVHDGLLARVAVALGLCGVARGEVREARVVVVDPRAVDADLGGVDVALRLERHRARRAALGGSIVPAEAATLHVAINLQLLRIHTSDNPTAAVRSTARCARYRVVGPARRRGGGIRPARGRGGGRATRRGLLHLGGADTRRKRRPVARLGWGRCATRHGLLHLGGADTGRKRH